MAAVADAVAVADAPYRSCSWRLNPSLNPKPSAAFCGHQGRAINCAAIRSLVAIERSADDPRRRCFEYYRAPMAVRCGLRIQLVFRVKTRCNAMAVGLSLAENAVARGSQAAPAGWGSGAPLFIVWMATNQPAETLKGLSAATFNKV